MQGNRLLSLNKELKSFRKKGKATAKSGKRLSASRSNGASTSPVKAIIVEDDVFIVEILQFFFDKRLNENQLTDELRDIAVKCLHTAIKSSRAMDLIPRPPKGVPSLMWLVSEGVQIAFRKAKSKGIYEVVKNTVKLKWRNVFESALLDSQTGTAQSTLTQQMAITNTALVVFIENTGALPFQWEPGSTFGTLFKEGLEKVVDYVSEEFSKWLNKFKDAKGKKYQEVIILEDSKATYANLKATLHDLAKRDFIIDVFTLTHGNRTSFSAYNGGSISDTDLRAIRDTYGQPLPIRVVYMMNCKGSGLNDDWVYVGAKASAGSLNNNYIPEPMMSKFWTNWQRGDTFTTAVNTAYTDSVNLINDTIAKAEDFIPLVGGKIKRELQSHIGPLLADSKPVVEGNGAITIDTAKIAAAKSFSQSRYSQAKYGTGEHVLTGMVSEGSVTPGYELDVHGVKFTYGEIIAMGDFYESYAQMVGASATELSKLKTLINKSKRYYETKAGANASDDEWQSATGGRYLKLAEDNFSHFAPSDNTLITSFSSTRPNHKKEWERYHAQAIGVVRKGVDSKAMDEALVVNAFGDHFLTDAFASGHLFNKDDLSGYFKSLVLTGNKINANGETMFGNIASRAFRGKLKDTFSKYETVDRVAYVWRPNMHTTDRFKKLLIGIMEQEPDIFGKTLVAKLVHDALNKSGVPVKNNVGDDWMLTGDGYLNTANLQIIKKAVKQSINNLMTAVNDAGPVAAFYKKVWDIVPRPTAAGVTLIKNTIRNYTNPLGSQIVDGADQLLQENYQALLDELVKRRILKKA